VGVISFHTIVCKTLVKAEDMFTERK